MAMGWVSIHRSVMDNFVWQDKPFNMGAAWIDLIMMANHEENKIVIHGRLISIERGQTYTSFRSLAERWGWGLGRVKRFIGMLEQEQMVNAEKTKNGTLLTLVKYDDFQNAQNTNGTPTEHRRNTRGTRTEHQRNTDGTPTERNNNDNNENNVNNEKNENNDNNETITIPLNPPSGEPRRYFPNDDRLEEAFKDFRKMRKAIKKPMTDRAITLMLSKLQKMTLDPDEQVRILEQSITNCWSDIYELKDKRRNGGKGEQSLAEKWGLGGFK